MSKPFRAFGVLVLAVAALVISAAAQPLQRGPNWERVESLPPGSEIRVLLAGGKTLRGFLQSATSDSLAINATMSQEKLLRPDIRRVQLKRPGHRGRNTLIGLAVGTGGGLAAGAAIDHAGPDYWFPNAGKAVFAPLGAIIGTVIGVAIPTGGWRTVYRVR